MRSFDEYLVDILGEECVEVAQRVFKASRFGLTETQEGQLKNNAERITEELHDLLTVALYLESRGILQNIIPSKDIMSKKIDKIHNYSKISIDQGKLDPSSI